ncbi:MAG: hypothetical protein ACFFA0_09485 [Promethearchaeota archaeon]
MFDDLILVGWLDGLSAGAIMFSALIFGVLSITKGVKNRQRLLIIAGIEVLAIGSYYSAPFVDFLWYGFMDTHIELWLYPLIAYTQVPVGVVFLAVLGGELIMPNYKQAVMGMYGALGMMLFVFIYTGVYAQAYEVGAPYSPPFSGFYYTIPTPAGELIDVSFAPWSPTVMLIWVFQFTNLIFMGGGFMIKAIQASGSLRRKFFLISLAFIIFFGTGIIDSFWGGVPKTVGRTIMISFGPLIYIGFR